MREHRAIGQIYEKSRKTVLVIGGTGIIGTPVVNKLLKQGGYVLHSINLDTFDSSSALKSFKRHFVDRNSKEYKSIITELTAKVGHWDAVIDLIASNSKDAEEIYLLLKDRADHFITMSTVLVYDRNQKNDTAITEENKLAETGVLGGYVDGKLELERFWHSLQDAPWTLLRPYHILGEHSLWVYS